MYKINPIEGMHLAGFQQHITTVVFFCKKDRLAIYFYVFSILEGSLVEFLYTC